MFQQKDYMPKHEYPECGGCTPGIIKESMKIKSNDPWDNLKVGNILLNSKGFEAACVEGIAGNVIFYSGKEPMETFMAQKSTLKALGWKIKDSTPKEEEFETIYLSDIFGGNCLLMTKEKAKEVKEKLEEIKRNLFS